MQQLVYPHGNSNCFLGSTYSVLHVGVFVWYTGNLAVYIRNTLQNERKQQKNKNLADVFNQQHINDTLQIMQHEMLIILSQLRLYDSSQVE